MKKNALFVFNGDPVCFIHVLLNALEMKENGHETKIIIEGAATRLIPELAKKQNPMHTLWDQAQKQDLIEGVCKACSQKMGTNEAARIFSTQCQIKPTRVQLYEKGRPRLVRSTAVSYDAFHRLIFNEPKPEAFGLTRSLRVPVATGR